MDCKSIMNIQVNRSSFRYKYTFLVSKLVGSIMEDDEWMKLAVEDKVVHKLWKARVGINLSLLCSVLFHEMNYNWFCV